MPELKVLFACCDTHTPIQMLQFSKRIIQPKLVPTYRDSGQSITNINDKGTEYMNRRHILKLLGGASAFAFTDTSPVQQRVLQVEDDECLLPECIHPTLGYIGLSLESVDELSDDIQPDYEVELVTEFPENSDGEDSDETEDDVEGRNTDENDRPLPDFYFEPTGLAVESGDIVQFTLSSPDHTVTAYHPDIGRQRRVPEGVPVFSSPVLADETFWLYRFDEAGVYDLLCAPHEIFGMVMRIVVDGSEEDFGEESEPDHRGPELTADLVLNDEALDPDYIAEQGEVHWEEVDDESKRLLVDFEEPPIEEELEDEDEETTYVNEVDEQVTLEYGETAELSNGVTFTIHGLTIYEILGDEEPEERDAFVVAEAEAENTSDEERTLPDPTHRIEILFGDQQDGTVFNHSALREGGYEQLEGRDVQPGVRREGVILFEVDEEYEEDEIDILWQDSLFVPDHGEVDVRWTVSV